MAEDNILVAEDLRKEFGGLVAVNNVNFAVPRGKVISLIGPNGAGKTTFFNMLTGVYKPTSGKVIFLGEDVTGKPPHAITARGVGRTFQNIRLFADMTMLENVLVGMHSRLKANMFTADPPHPRRQGARRSGRGRRRVSCSASPASSSTRTSSPAGFRTATSAGSRWRGRSRPTRSSCCSTSRRPG